MADTSGIAELSNRDIYYFQQRNKNRVFEKIVSFFAEEAEQRGVTKKQIAQRLDRDPAQISRWLSAPNNLTLDSISDLLLALDAEMDYEIARFSERAPSNYTHPLMPHNPPQFQLNSSLNKIGSFPIGVTSSFTVNFLGASALNAVGVGLVVGASSVQGTSSVTVVSSGITISGTGEGKFLQGMTVAGSPFNATRQAG